jgi:hypothetical protein
MTDYHDTLEYELGERASQELFREELSMLYTSPMDRAWAVVALCYLRVAKYAPDQAWEWYPQFDENRMWMGRN